MIANRSPQRRSPERRTPVWLATVLSVAVCGGLTAYPAPAAAHDEAPTRQGVHGHDHDHGHGQADLRPGRELDESKKKGKEAKKDDHGGHPPELPNIAYAIGTFAKDTGFGKFLGNHGNWWVVRGLFSLLIPLLFVVFLSRMYRNRSLRPSRFQTVVEMVVEAFDNLVSGILGKEVGRRYLPFLGSLFIFILSANLLGIVPLGMSPTAGFGLLSSGFLVPTCTTALALCTLLVTQYTSFKLNGIKGVILHWCGNPTDAVTWVIGIIFIPLHIFSDLIVKPLSLLLRLFGNIYGEDVLLGSMLMLGIMMFSFLPANSIPLGFPLELPFMFVALLLSTIQALVFTLLSTIYIMMVLPHGDHDEDHDKHQEEAHAPA